MVLSPGIGYGSNPSTKFLYFAFVGFEFIIRIIYILYMSNKPQTLNLYLQSSSILRNL